jgi:hypothetical protein
VPLLLCAVELKSCSVLETVLVPTCPLCQDPIRDQLDRHVGRHMEEISFAVVTKPYEDWDFYDGSSYSSQGNYLLKRRPVMDLTTSDLQPLATREPECRPEQHIYASAVPRSRKRSTGSKISGMLKSGKVRALN